MANDEWVVTMPKLGETVTEGTIGSWPIQAGDTVSFDDPQKRLRPALLAPLRITVGWRGSRFSGVDAL